jgi:hypothetical protein
MRFTVVWSQKAEGQLFDLWSNFPGNRYELTQATDEFDQDLREDPQLKGRLLGGCRIMIRSPFVILYGIDEGDRKAIVLSIKKF